MKKIILAIKNDSIANTYQDVFEKNIFSVLKTNHGKEAFDMAKKEKADIVLADVNLYGFDGFELLKKMEADESLKTIPVIIFSEVNRLKDKKRVLELDAKGYISSNDFSPNQVVNAVKRVLSGPFAFRVAFQKELYNASELVEELTGSIRSICTKCESNLVLEVIKQDDNSFGISVICPNCKNI